MPIGQAPTNYAIETAIDKVAAAVGLERIEVRRRNFIRKEEFPYLIPSGSTYDSGDYHTVVDKELTPHQREVFVALVLTLLAALIAPRPLRRLARLGVLSYLLAVGATAAGAATDHRPPRESTRHAGSVRSEQLHRRERT